MCTRSGTAEQGIGRSSWAGMGASGQAAMGGMLWWSDVTTDKYLFWQVTNLTNLMYHN